MQDRQKLPIDVFIRFRPFSPITNFSDAIFTDFNNTEIIYHRKVIRI
jgi:hypothetical protein